MENGEKKREINIKVEIAHAYEYMAFMRIYYEWIYAHSETREIDSRDNVYDSFVYLHRRKKKLIHQQC